MINETFKFLAEEINKYLSQKLGVTTDQRLVWGNVGKALDNDSSGQNALSGKAIMSLINVEEDRVAMQQENYIKSPTGITYKNPPVYLNLYVLFAVNRADYGDSLKYLALIIQFFQSQNVFTPLSNPSLDNRIQKLICDLFSVNFEQLNQIWSVLGGKYLPSVLYKIRQITIDEDAIDYEAGFIKEIDLNDTLIDAIS
ncbi:MAG TPA: DUF4255 domain-containing protein [Mucilaginibacter sp.]|nr:DUF4255 domain-containing protein [Mucilaginibacter sp.]